jgi:hypothetical protein
MADTKSGGHMKQSAINKLYSNYSKGIISREAFEGAIYDFFTCNQGKTCLCHWKRDEYEDYLSWFYPRLQKAINSYADVGSSFEAFMHKFMLTSSKEYNINMTIKKVTEYSTWSARVPELYVYEEPPDYSHENTGTREKITRLITAHNGRKNTRRLLALVLKCYYFVSDDFIDSIAPKIGIEKKELALMMKKMKELRRKRDDRIYLMKERLYCQYYRCLVYEKRVTLVRDDSQACYRLKIKAEKSRQRLEKMRKRLLAIRVEATNKQVAEVIGVKKGTVDSSLHTLKNKWKNMAKNYLLN